MNGAAPQYPGGAFGITSAECNTGGTGPGGTPGPTTTPTCFIEDAFIIPSDTSCRGPATLRWMWNSAEGLETYANCLDIEIQGAGGGGGGGTGGGSGGGGSIGGGSSGSAVSTTGSSNSGTTTIMVLILLALIVGFGYYFYKNKPSPPASSDVVAAPVDVELPRRQLRRRTLRASPTAGRSWSTRSRGIRIITIRPTARLSGRCLKLALSRRGYES